MTTHQPAADLSPFAALPEDERPTEPNTPPAPERRRWSTGHTVAAAVVAGGVLLSGGVALAASDSSGTPGFGQHPGQGQLPGQGGFAPGQPPQGPT